MPELHPQFLVDSTGKPMSVLLPFAEYEALMERLEDIEDLEDARAALAQIACGEEDLIPWEDVKAEYGL